METVTATGTCSSLITEYGKFIDTKKGWKAIKEAGGDIPIPSASLIQTALPTHSVIVPGTVDGTVASPDVLEIKQIQHLKSTNE